MSQDGAGRGFGLDDAAVRRVARLARLALDDAAVADCRERLGAVLAHMEVLKRLDLEGVRPLTHPSDAVNRWDEDVAREALAPGTLMRMAPEVSGPFIKVPKVLGDGGGG